MISAVNAFKAKLGVWISHLGNRRLHHFPNLEKMSQAIEDKEAFHPEQFCSHLDKVANEFSRSLMKIIKSKYRSHLTDRHLTDCLRLAVCSYEPDYKALTDSVQSQPSH
ncbi:hypothetical protein NQZ68_027459 [Dissostichus eleginoides]|nr:hypothetical protein NQZ68_027459 [Dissostichus eleginoides]